MAAIDFGTTYSGYAFSSTNEWSKVLTSNWTGGKVITLKTPTAILLDSEQKFLAFGYEAEDMYMDLARDEEHEDHYFFHRFKMILHSEKVCKKNDQPWVQLYTYNIQMYGIKYMIIDKSNCHCPRRGICYFSPILKWGGGAL